MARDYWVETLPSGRQRFVKISLKRACSNPYDGNTQSSRGRRVDFVDVTREEYSAVLSRESALNKENEGLRRENHALKTNWRACNEELRRLQTQVPSLETTVRNLEQDNRELRRSSDHEHHHHHLRGSRDDEDTTRRLRHKVTKLTNENDALLARIRNLERDILDGVGDRPRKHKEETSVWKRRYERLDLTVKGLQNKFAEAIDRNRRLEEACEIRARSERRAMRDVDRYKAILRQHGLRDHIWT